MPDKKKCFVIMGFGEKTDLATSRILDLDKTYRIIIKKAVEEAGLECIRADDIIHSGIIDKPMYELLFAADIVVADLSTSNANAIYELGVRHALRPSTTIVMAEKQFKFPFDIGHLLIRPYEHLGKGIDAEEAERVRTELKNAIQTLLEKQDVDSPVFTFLPNLAMAKLIDKLHEQIEEAAVKADENTSELMDLFKESRAVENWKGAKRNLKRLLEKRPKDDYIIQQLALATYKSKDPDSLTALEEAKQILQGLHPQQTADPETLGIWGAIHKRLWELKQDRQYLDEGIWAYEKGFYLKNDYYNGINFAFLLNVRASISEGNEAIADVVIARRVRKKVLSICRDILEKGINDDEGKPDKEQIFWVNATIAEALAGIGEKDKAQEALVAAVKEAPESWMEGTLREQLEKLNKLLETAPVA
jgi:tetratricopeptide (TPR) repeat protein